MEPQIFFVAPANISRLLILIFIFFIIKPKMCNKEVSFQGFFREVNFEDFGIKIAYIIENKLKFTLGIIYVV